MVLKLHETHNFLPYQTLHYHSTAITKSTLMAKSRRKASY